MAVFSEALGHRCSWCCNTELQTSNLEVLPESWRVKRLFAFKIVILKPHFVPWHQEFLTAPLQVRIFSKAI